MKKLNKILVVFIILFLAICQSNKIYSYDLEEVKDAIEYKEVKAEEESEPDDYDIEIDARNMIENERVPYIQTSIDTVLYEDNDLFDIDFFGINSGNNENEAWNFISNLVKTIFRITLYISAACLLTLLIYIGVTMVSSSISPNLNILPFGKKMLNNNNSQMFGLHDPKKNLREKIAIEQWIITALLLAM